MVKYVNPLSGLQVCTQYLLGEVELKVEMQIYINVWDRKEEEHKCLEKFLKPACMEEAVSAKLWNCPSLN